MNRNLFLLFLWGLQFAAIVLKMADVLKWSWWITLALIEYCVVMRLLAWLLEWLAWTVSTPEQRATDKLLKRLRELKNSIKQQR